MRDGWTSLGYACARNKPELVKLLLNYGADPNLAGPKPPIFETLDHLDCMRYLLAAGADPNINAGRGTPIQFVIGKPDAIRLLVGAGADVNRPKLLELAVYEGNMASVLLLLEAGHPIGGLKDDYYRPLNTAVRDNKPEFVNLLLSRGADPNLRGGEGFPVQIASAKPEILKLLIAGGADVKQSKVLELAVYQGSLASIPILLDAGYPIGGLKEDYYRPVNTAVRDSKPEALALLISRGADLNLRGGEGIPLGIACDKPAMMRQLLAGGADATKAVGALEKAVFRNCIEAIEMLIDAGAPINGHPDDHYRPLQTAIRDNYPQIVTLLLSRGADPNHKGEFP